LLCYAGRCSYGVEWVGGGPVGAVERKERKRGADCEGKVNVGRRAGGLVSSKRGVVYFPSEKDASKLGLWGKGEKKRVVRGEWAICGEIARFSGLGKGSGAKMRGLLQKL